MMPNLYQQFINASYDNFAYFLNTKEGLWFVLSTAFVTGFAIGVGYAMKRFLDIKNQIEDNN